MHAMKSKIRLGDINIGQLIRQRVDECHWTYSDFAKAINCSRSSLYNIFNSRDISVSRLIVICNVLNHNFFSDMLTPESESTAVCTPASASPAISLPLTENGITLTDLPPEIIGMLSKALNSTVQKTDDSDQTSR